MEAGRVGGQTPLPLVRHRLFEVCWGQAAPATVHTRRQHSAVDGSECGGARAPLRPGDPPGPFMERRRKTGRKGPPPTPGVPPAVPLLLRE